MARVRFDVGATADILSPGEHAQHLEQLMRSWEFERYRGVKILDLPQIQGTATGGALLIGQAPTTGPRAGYVWSVQWLSVDGLTSGTSPDVVNFYRNSTSNYRWWQLNGNQFGETFGKLQKVLYGGDTLLCQSQGTFAATGTITVSGTVIECPAEMIGKLA